ncbi:TPA: hypothetical protein NJ265_003544 [Vibrio parahaemolyticus]|uniref:endonuclease domain-containing protein n=1 Tax=Vibrio parahaemolyticus TaxID=670 RepID=UPI00111E74BB|nr:endonuclease domain-containing protein [Vibrio parahaemolyticus]EHR0229279.1 hypothetical protein [Vibrio parahaemolyticus]MCG6509826.1 endonuclease domain-containing protein [Vibrio parahaemolyticus]TOH02684.1 hypothetical protein CGI88_18535 [Vibrio parahaemolyticus]TOK95752.1 hypothetical protein CGI06_21745 [Vibrio parahaemolyticus]TOP89894.1 hypothetical protein CGH07_16540 [Vibrio parahaemolyticus]
MRVLKTSERNEFRHELVRKQNHKCKLCQTEVTGEDSHLDHDHLTGYCRSALCPRCNRVLGVIETWSRIINMSLPKWLTQIVKYLSTDYSDNPIYPSHPNDMTKKFKRLSKADMIELLEDIYPEMDLTKYTKSQLAKLYRDSWKTT